MKISPQDLYQHPVPQFQKVAERFRQITFYIYVYTKIPINGS